MRRCRPKAGQHVLDDMVASDQNAALFNLRFQMPVAQMPGQSQQMMCVLPAYFQQFLSFCEHLYHPAVLELQAVAMAKLDCVRQIKQEFQAGVTAQDNSSAMALILVQGDGAQGVGPPASGSQAFDCA